MEFARFPKPLQRPLPIVMAGGADAVVERIGRQANGWIDTFLLPDAMRAHIDRLCASAREAGVRTPENRYDGRT